MDICECKKYFFDLCFRVQEVQLDMMESLEFLDNQENPDHQAILLESVLVYTINNIIQ